MGLERGRDPPVDRQARGFSGLQAMAHAAKSRGRGAGEEWSRGLRESRSASVDRARLALRAARQSGDRAGNRPARQRGPATRADAGRSERGAQADDVAEGGGVAQRAGPLSLRRRSGPCRRGERHGGDAVLPAAVS